MARLARHPDLEKGKLKRILNDIAWYSFSYPHHHHNDQNVESHLNRGGDIAVAELPGGVPILHLDVLAQAAADNCQNQIWSKLSSYTT